MFALDVRQTRIIAASLQSESLCDVCLENPSLLFASFLFSSPPRFCFLFPSPSRLVSSFYIHSTKQSATNGDPSVRKDFTLESVLFCFTKRAWQILWRACWWRWRAATLYARQHVLEAVVSLSVLCTGVSRRGVTLHMEFGVDMWHK